MKITKQRVSVLIGAVLLVGIIWLLYMAITFRSRPPSKRMVTEQRIKLQSGDEAQINESLRLLLVFRVSTELRPEFELLSQHEDAEIRLLAITLIKRYRDVEAAILLTRLLEDSDPDVAAAASRGLHNVNNSLGLPSEQQHFGP